MAMIRLSVVMPCFHKARDLSRVLAHNAAYLVRGDVETILVLDEPSEESEIARILDAVPALQARMIVNDREHVWRSPAVALNVGIRSAVGRFVLACSPESAFAGDVPTELLALLERHPADAVMGQVAWAQFAQAYVTPVEALFEAARAAGNQRSYADLFYGSVAAARETFFAVGGFDERAAGWGGEDDNLRLRMAMNGALLILADRIRLLHLSDEPRSIYNPSAPRNPPEILRTLAAPTEVRANPDGWGTEFGRVARDWIVGV